MGIITCSVKREGGEESVFSTKLQFLPTLPTFCTTVFASIWWVTWGKLLNFHKAQFSHVENGDNNGKLPGSCCEDYGNWLLSPFSTVPGPLLSSYCYWPFQVGLQQRSSCPVSFEPVRLSPVQKQRRAFFFDQRMEKLQLGSRANDLPTGCGRVSFVGISSEEAEFSRG